MNPGVLLDAVVASIQGNATLLTTELNGDNALIVPYRDQYSVETNIQTAILNAPKPSILVAYMGSAPGEKETIEVEKHKFSCYFRARDAASDSYYGMYHLLVNGEMPDGVLWRYYTIHADCYPPEKITFKRLTNAPDNLDLWELSFFLTENGG